MANLELPHRGRVLPWEVNRREQPINDSKTTVPASAAQFFSTAALVSVEKQFRYIRTVTVRPAISGNDFLVVSTTVLVSMPRLCNGTSSDCETPIQESYGSVPRTLGCLFPTWLAVSSYWLSEGNRQLVPL
ncbi:hypothetical protein P9112_011205 [Eukaryota sp. TZLM1-RC]